MKKLVIFTVLAVIGSGLTLYSVGKYAHLKPVIQEMATALETFVVNLEKAENADAVAAALDNYTQAIIKFAPKVNEMMKKYPELKDETIRPEELKPLMDKMDKLAKKLATLFAKLGQYKNDPKVKAANERWEKALALMDEGEDEE